MKLIVSSFALLLSFLSTIHSNAQIPRYYDLYIDKISLPTIVGIDTTIAIEIQVKIFDGKGKELNFAEPSNIKAISGILSFKKKKMVDVHRGEELYFKLIATNKVGYNDRPQDLFILIERTGKFKADAEGQVTVSGNIGYIAYGQSYNQQKLFWWEPTISWHLEESTIK